jgi:HD-GYP domain-containing protein (c-di-GMP phosphodiesterase class II)
MYDADMRRLLARLETLNEIGIALSAEADPDRLVDMILTGAKQLTCADAGTFYRIDGDSLYFAALQNDTLGIRRGGDAASPAVFAPIPLRDDQGRLNRRCIAARAVIDGRTFNVPDAQEASDFDFSGARAIDRESGYVSRSLLTVPLKNHEHDVVGVLQLINAKDPHTGRIVAFTEADQRLAESLASQAAVALSKRALIDSQNALFDSFVRVLAKAIDAKNPHTSAHCQRVPELTLMLANAVHEVDWGPLRDVRFTPDEFHEIRIAAWLHDCGKVTTPEHIINKATKLETIVDRIQLIEARFEILRRDLRIRLLEQALEEAGGGLGEVAQAHWAEWLAAESGDLAFLRAANFGGEAMSDADIQRVASIALAYRWRDRGGVERSVLDTDEVQNLQIRRGTLTADERRTMNGHMHVTIDMLESLSYPKHLKRVPEIAGGHHERMDGTGFPRGLTREQLSIPARIMSIADIFEALTAADRPYKKAMTLSEALAILGRMRLDNHIDPDIFDVLVHEKVYLRYAERFLPPAQIDSADIERVAGLARPSTVALRPVPSAE